MRTNPAPVNSTLPLRPTLSPPSFTSTGSEQAGPGDNQVTGSLDAAASTDNWQPLIKRFPITVLVLLAGWFSSLRPLGWRVSLYTPTGITYNDPCISK